jgi:sec-independent protein translocase protein TatA
MIPNIGPMEIAIVLIVAIIVLGPKKLPDFGRSLGSSMREFKRSIAGEEDAEKERAAVSEGVVRD